MHQKLKAKRGSQSKPFLHAHLFNHTDQVRFCRFTSLKLLNFLGESILICLLMFRDLNQISAN